MRDVRVKRACVSDRFGLVFGSGRDVSMTSNAASRVKLREPVLYKYTNRLLPTL